MEKVKKREDRMKRVAERQAALKRKDDEKNMKIKVGLVCAMLQCLY